MRVLVVFLLFAAVSIAGCWGDFDRSRDRTIHAPELGPSIANGHMVPPATTSTLQTDDNPLTCQPGNPPAKNEMMDLLARISTYAPLDHLTGPALEIEQQWLHLQSAGWPAEPATWTSHAWFDLSIAGEADQTYVVNLQHGLHERSDDKFLVVCSDGRWKVKQRAVGRDGQWLEPPQEVLGQRGVLTLQLVVELIRIAQTSTGPWLAQVTFGNALEWGRVDAVYRARGLKPLPDPWRGATDRVELTQPGEFQAEGQFLGSGFSVRLERVDGLWKIQDYTEGGAWVGPPDDVHLRESGRVFDSPFGILLGVTDEKDVQRLLGTPDLERAVESGKICTYHLRRLEIWYDVEGRVASLSMKTGAPMSGVRVGSPVALWELVYGPQDGPVRATKQRLTYVAEDGKVVEIRVTAESR